MSFLLRQRVITFLKVFFSLSFSKKYQTELNFKDSAYNQLYNLLIKTLQERMCSSGLRNVDEVLKKIKKCRMCYYIFIRFVLTFFFLKITINRLIPAYLEVLVQNLIDLKSVISLGKGGEKGGGGRGGCVH